MQTLEDLLARWDSPEGHPYKGSLIDWEAYEANPDSLGCMCAQGQALHVLGGWEPARIKAIGEQAEADREVAKLLNISVAHAILLRQVNDKVEGAPSIVLTDPGKVLGSEWSRLLDFWWHLDQMTDEQWDAARDAARAAARGTAGAAASEIQGAHLLRERGKPFFFLPMFGFATPEDIPARPANYGELSA